MDELMGPLQEVFKDLKQKWNEMQEEQPLWDVIMGFVNAVDWKVRAGRSLGEEAMKSAVVEDGDMGT